MLQMSVFDEDLKCVPEVDAILGNVPVDFVETTLLSLVHVRL